MSRDALVVGISSYRWLPDLGAPANDAEAIAQLLQTQGDFRVQRMPEIVKNNQTQVGITTPVTVAELETALVKLFKPKGHNIPHTALFYYSGHGLQKDAGIQEGYLATSDANPEGGLYGLSLFWLRRLLQESPVRQRILLLDCCHSGEILNYLEADPGAKSGTDRLFMAASREYESAYESLEGPHSVFTQALLDGLDPSSASSGTVTNYHLTDWVSNALRTEVQQPLFENSGGEIILTRHYNATTILRSDLVQDICPYRGLEYFDESHADYFFGREDLTDQVTDKLRTHNFVAIVGASGSGKSSLVRAGLIHRLRLGRQFSGQDNWQVKVITPTDYPIKSLAHAFVNPEDSAIARAEQLQRAEILLKDSQGLAQLVRASLMPSESGTSRSRLLLVIDQFEEVFTLWNGGHADRDRHHFFNSLLDALDELGDQLSIVVVLRADFFGKCSLFTRLAEKIEQNLVTVTPLTYEQIKASIVKPAQRVGLVCEPNLTYNILRDIVGAPGELPLLQYTLLELWHHRQLDPAGGPACLTLDAYTELGGVRGTLQKRADAIFYSLDPQEQRVAKRIFIGLTQLGDGTEDTRRRILKSELISAQFPAELVEQVIEKLVRGKLIVTNRVTLSHRVQERSAQSFANVSTALRFVQLQRGKTPGSKPIATLNFMSSVRTKIAANYNLGLTNRKSLPGGLGFPLTENPELSELSQETIDVAHETLIRHWSLLRSWLDENREMLRRQRKLEQEAREWNSLNQPRAAEDVMRGNHLTDAEEFLATYPDELSAIAQKYIQVSRGEAQRSQKQLQLLKLSISGALLIALGITLNQYHSLARSQADKNYQIKVATSRQQAAIAQSILQDPKGDPTAALLISRLAVEKGERTKEAEESLRTALQQLRLQSNLVGHQGVVRQVDFSKNQRQMVTAGEDGTLRVWSLNSATLQHRLSWSQPDRTPPSDSPSSPESAGSATSASQPRPADPPILEMALSPNGQQVAAIAQASPDIQIWSLESGQRLRRLRGFTTAATQIAFSPNGTLIAAASADHTVRVWNAQSGVLQTHLRRKMPIQRLQFSPNGQTLMLASGNTLQLIQPQTGQIKTTLHHAGQISCATFSPDGHWIAAGSQTGHLRVWAMGAARVPSLKRDVQGSVGMTHVLFSPDSTALATADQSRQIRLWRLATGKMLPIPTGAIASPEATQQPLALAFSPDSQQLVATVSQAPDDASTGNRRQHYPFNNALQTWSVATGQALNRLTTGPVESVRYSVDGSLMATVGEQGAVRIWSATTGSELPTLTPAGKLSQWVTFHPTPPASSLAGENMIAIAPDGRLNRWHLPGRPTPALPVGEIATASQSPTAPQTPERSHPGTPSTAKLPAARTWGFLSKLQFGKKTTPSAIAPEISPSPTGSIIAPVGNIFPLPPAQLLKKQQAGSWLMGAALSPDTRRLAISDSLGGISIWQVHPNWQMTLLRRIPPIRTDAGVTMMQQLTISPDQTKLLGIGDDQRGRIWDIESGKLLHGLVGHSATITRAEFSRDGAWIVTASHDRSTRIWETASGREHRRFNHRAGIASAHFSPNGQQLVIASLDSTAQVLDWQSGTYRVILAGHHAGVLDANFSPDGQLLITASEDGTAKLWDAQTGTERASLRPMEPRGEMRAITRAFFSLNGRYVATLDSEGQLRTWVVDWEDLLDLAEHRSLRQLKPDECLRYLGLPANGCPVLPIVQ